MFRFIFFSLTLVLSSLTFAQTFSLPETSSTGSYSIGYSALGSMGFIEEWDGNMWKGVGGGAKFGTIAITKTISGTYSYRMQNCNPGQSGANCGVVAGTKSIVVSLVPSAPTLSVSGVENSSSNIDTNGTFTFSWPSVVGAETYALERNGGVVYYDTAAAYATVSLGFGTYTFRVKACRTNATVCSGYSNTITITVQYPQPTMPSGLTFSGLENAATNTDSNGSFSISWGESVGAEAYLMQRNGTDWYWGTNRSYSESGLQPGAYTYKVRGCRDLATNCSSYTTPQTITVIVPTPSSSSLPSSSAAISSSRSSSSVALPSSSRSSSSVAVISISSSSSSSSIPVAQTTTTSYAYDDLGRVKTVTHPNAVKNTYTYDSADNRTKKESTAN